MPNINLTPVKSSSIAAWGWVENTNTSMTNQVFVEFSSGKIYEYLVPLSVVLELKIASSKGTYVNKMKASYEGVLVSDEYVFNAFEGGNKDAKTSVPPHLIILSARDMTAFARF